MFLTRIDRLGRQVPGLAVDFIEGGAVIAVCLVMSLMLIGAGLLFLAGTLATCILWPIWWGLNYVYGPGPAERIDTD